MNAIILSAIWGVVMMFGGVFFKKTHYAKILGYCRNNNYFVANILEFFGIAFFNVDTKGMLRFDNFGFILIQLLLHAHLLFFLLNGKRY